MAEPTQLEYKLKDLAALMVRDQGIKDGHWMILIRFAHTAATIETPIEGATPASISRVVSIGISRVDQPNPLSVDASEVSAEPQRA